MKMKEIAVFAAVLIVGYFLGISFPSTGQSLAGKLGVTLP